MNKLEALIKEMKETPQNVRFLDLAKVCSYYFGNPRNKGTSHYVYKTPWKGDPRVNIQRGKNGKAKTYQIKQVLSAVKKIKEHG